MQVTFASYESYKYREVFLVTERRNGRVYKTRPLGFCLATREAKKDEIYSPLSTALTRQETITLELLSQ